MGLDRDMQERLEALSETEKREAMVFLRDSLGVPSRPLRSVLDEAARIRTSLPAGVFDSVEALHQGRDER